MSAVPYGSPGFLEELERDAKKWEELAVAHARTPGFRGDSAACLDAAERARAASREIAHTWAALMQVAQAAPPESVPEWVLMYLPKEAGG